MAVTRHGRSGAQPVSDLVSELLDPVMRKRAGISVGLVQSWEEIVGPRLAARSRPQKISWPRRATETDPFQPAVLEIACEGLAALHLQHETSDVIARVNSFLGFGAIGRIRIVQRPVTPAQKPAAARLRQLSASETAALKSKVDLIENEELRASLEQLGRSVIGRKNPKN